ncbi:MAG: PQQ-binding-like beta-propeller repeat protein [Sphingomonadaceae bacterium]
MKVMKQLALLGVIAIAISGCSTFRGKKPRTAVLGQRIAILTSEQDAGSDPSLAAVSILLPPATLNTEWAQPGGNAAKSMDHLALGPNPVKVWEAKIAGTNKYRRLASPPVAAEGRIYVIDSFAVVHAFNATTGAREWEALVGNSDDAKGGRNLISGERTTNRGSLFGGGVSYEGGKLYATNGLGDVAALNAADGKRLWQVRPAGPLRGAPSVGIGTVIVTTQDNQIIALAEADGKVAWTESAGLEVSGIFGVGAPAIAQGTIVAGFSSGELNAYRYENGRTLWSDALSRTSISTSVSSLSDVDASPVIDRGRVFAIGKGGRMVSLDLVTGQRLWEINLAGISTPWVVGEWVFVVDDDARLLCIARATGKVRWLTQLPGYKNVKKKQNPIDWAGPVLAGDRLILASSRGAMVSVSATDGTVQSQSKIGGTVLLSPIVANNMLFMLTNEGRLIAWR